MASMSTESPSLPRVQRLRHEIVRRELQVARVETLGPHLRSVTFSGEALDGFVSASFDDHVKLFLDVDGDSVRRDYTPRRHDAAARELTIEFDLKKFEERMKPKKVTPKPLPSDYIGPKG